MSRTAWLLTASSKYVHFFLSQGFTKVPLLACEHDNVQILTTLVWCLGGGNLHSQTLISEAGTSDFSAVLEVRLFLSPSAYLVLNLGDGSVF